MSDWLRPAPPEIQEQAKAFAELIGKAGQFGTGFVEATYEPTGERYRVEVFTLDQQEGLLHENIRLHQTIKVLQNNINVLTRTAQEAASNEN